MEELLRRSFKPEFLNRVDDIIVFSKLSRDEIKQIAGNMLKTLSKRLEAMDINLTFSEQACDKLAEEGFDDVYGARPLRRTIQSKIEDVVSEKILDGSIKKGDSVECTYENGEFTFVSK